MVGKRINGALYIHHTYVKTLDTESQNMLKIAEPFIEASGCVYNVIKISKRMHRVSFLYYDSFDIIDHPVLLKCTLVNLITKKIKVYDYSTCKNKFILHRKELLVDHTYPLYNNFIQITLREEAAGYYQNTRIIGTEKGWNNIIKGGKMSSALYKVACPICGSNLIYHLKNNKEFKVLIIDDEHVEEQICDNDNSNIHVYCSKDETHYISREIIDDAIEVAHGLGY